MENPNDFDEPLELSEYARRKDLDPHIVRNRIVNGTLSRDSYFEDDFGDIMVYPKLADIDFAFLSDDDRVLATQEKARDRGEIPELTSEPGAPDVRLEKTLSDVQKKAAEYREAKIDTETLKARKLELEIAARESRLLDAEKVRQRLHKLVQETKDALLNIPGRAAPVVLGLKSPLEVEQFLRKEIDETLSGISKLTESWTEKN